ncbi:hypothetical protein OE88DRAFT_1647233 [Heliocybe sulcata]|uniref:Heterokaryon incompatibility domain-containing protein n=1 Tax=Heliocybe sulcata TaxID=5364 RepID=A0A5C3MU03_9AGAM|nr:hypothetical protein OE88DRAFT_1647233 [Heliocybe sulcata]
MSHKMLTGLVRRCHERMRMDLTALSSKCGFHMLILICRLLHIKTGTSHRLKFPVLLLSATFQPAYQLLILWTKLAEITNTYNGTKKYVCFRLGASQVLTLMTFEASRGLGKSDSSSPVAGSQSSAATDSEARPSSTACYCPSAESLPVSACSGTTASEHMSKLAEAPVPDRSDGHEAPTVPGAVASPRDGYFPDLNSVQPRGLMTGHEATLVSSQPPTSASALSGASLLYRVSPDHRQVAATGVPVYAAYRPYASPQQRPDGIPVSAYGPGAYPAVGTPQYHSGQGWVSDQVTEPQYSFHPYCAYPTSPPPQYHFRQNIMPSAGYTPSYPPPVPPRYPSTQASSSNITLPCEYLSRPEPALPQFRPRSGCDRVSDTGSATGYMRSTPNVPIEQMPGPVSPYATSAPLQWHPAGYAKTGPAAMPGYPSYPAGVLSGHGPVDDPALNATPIPGRLLPHTRVPLQEPPRRGWPWYIISEEEAAFKCKDLGMEGMLYYLNKALGLPRQVWMWDLGVKPLLESFVDSDQGYDFGDLYARVRTLWHRHTWNWNEQQTPSGCWSNLDVDVMQMYAQLQEAGDTLDNDRNTRVKGDCIDRRRNELKWTRRLWDLRAHRVVPYHFSLRYYDGKFQNSPYYAVSHSWAATTTGIDTATVAWRHNAQRKYAWLDVLCLQQAGGPAEALRAPEWQVDIPTIGYIYQDASKIVQYYNGLGVTFECCGWTGERHWLRRVWTIQEISDHSIVGGLPEGLRAEDLLDQKSEEDGGHEAGERFLRIEQTAWDGVYGGTRESLASHWRAEMQIAACGMLLGHSGDILLYKEDMALEDAWDLLVRHTLPMMAYSLLWSCSTPGKGRYKWRPSWDELLHMRLPSSSHNRSETGIGVLNSNYAHQSRSRTFTGSAELQWHHKDADKLEGNVCYRDKVIELEFSIFRASAEEAQGGKVRLVGNSVEDTDSETRHTSVQSTSSNTDALIARLISRATGGAPRSFIYLMVCREVEFAPGELGFQKIAVVPTREVDSSILRAVWKEKPATFI